jgi:hypothetical protein
MSGAKTNGAKTKRVRSKRGVGTDWDQLRRRSAANIRKRIAADSEAHATDAEFWKRAKVVMPAQKKS